MFFKRDRVSKSLIDSAKGMVGLIGDEKIRTDFLNKINKTEHEYASAEEIERIKKESEQFQHNLSKGILMKAIHDFNNSVPINHKLTIEEIKPNNPIAFQMSGDFSSTRKYDPHITIVISQPHKLCILLHCTEKNRHLAYQEILLRISTNGMKHYTHRREMINLQIVEIHGETLEIRI